jgi:hypothetical protein
VLQLVYFAMASFAPSKRIRQRDLQKSITCNECGPCLTPKCTRCYFCLFRDKRRKCIERICVKIPDHQVYYRERSNRALARLNQAARAALSSSDEEEDDDDDDDSEEDDSADQGKDDAAASTSDKTGEDGVVASTGTKTPPRGKIERNVARENTPPLQKDPPSNGVSANFDAENVPQSPVPDVLLEERLPEHVFRRNKERQKELRSKSKRSFLRPEGSPAPVPPRKKVVQGPTPAPQKRPLKRADRPGPLSKKKKHSHEDAEEEEEEKKKKEALLKTAVVKLRRCDNLTLPAAPVTVLPPSLPSEAVWLSRMEALEHEGLPEAAIVFRPDLPLEPELEDPEAWFQRGREYIRLYGDAVYKYTFEYLDAESTDLKNAPERCAEAKIRARNALEARSDYARKAKAVIALLFGQAQGPKKNDMLEKAAELYQAWGEAVRHAERIQARMMIVGNPNLV